MSAAVRWLTLVLVGWAGARAATLGVVPGAELFELGRGEARSMPASSQFPPLEPAVSLGAHWPTEQVDRSAAPGALPLQPIAIPYYVPVFRAAADPEQRRSRPDHPFLNAWADLRDWPVSRPAALPGAALSAPPPDAVPALSRIAASPKFDRLQLTTWALLRSREAVGASRSLANGGTLGGSQAGARLTYRVSPRLAASLRMSSAVGSSQSEAAAGLRFTPLTSIPVSITAERRQALGDHGGASGFALFAEGGSYGNSLWGFHVDGYAQAGIVGVRDHALFADGAFTLTRPVYRQFAAGFGVWAGVQPDLYRIDAGPRLSYRVRPNVRVHLDWRQKLGGSAAPGSGPAVTLAGDF